MAEAGTNPLPTGSAEDIADLAEADLYFAHVGTRSQGGVVRAAELNLDSAGEPVLGSRDHDELRAMANPRFVESGH